MIYTQEQIDVIEDAAKWYYKSSEQVFQITGGPGTGKSVILNAIIDRIGLNRTRVLPMSYTGSAAMVMRMKGFINARTICSALFHAVEAFDVNPDGSYRLDGNGKPRKKLKFVPKPVGSLKDIDLMVIDEGGSCPLSIKNVIEQHGIKVLVAGDINQLPPVKDDPAYLYNTDKLHYLTTIMRQWSGSAIPYLADRALKGLPIQCGYYGDVLVIDENDLRPEMLLNSDIFICGKNTTRDYYNNKIRELNGKFNQLPMAGDKVVCRKNNWNIDIDGISLSNGLIGIVLNDVDISVFSDKKFMMNFSPAIMPSIQFTNIPVDFNYFSAPYYERNIIRNDRFSEGEKFEFAYAVTTHIAQGSQYRQGIYFEEYLSSEINRNLNYTGITRFSDNVIYVKRHKTSFPGSKW